ncbi:MAG: dihydrolipoamide acetyltransferase family protein [Bacteroidota bacterium]|jgi:2-oxoglutarate dehydrogenase E2 component (dihydrolipoamide succinyltransferase)
MAQFELTMPKMGESVAEATIIKWLKNEGEPVKMDEPVLEIATDKVDSEIPSPFEGTLIKKLFKEGDVIQVGAVIAIIGSASSDTQNNVIVSTPSTVAQKVTEESDSKLKQGPETKLTESFSDNSKERFYSPLVKNIAKQEGISVQELNNISGTGKDGRVTKSDILAYIPNKSKGTEVKISSENSNNIKQTPAVSSNTSEQVSQSISLSGNDEIIEMDRMRKLIADHMVMSKKVSPHVTSFVEADVTNLVLWRDKVKSSFEKKEGEKITFTPCFIEACVKAIKDFPMINVSIEGTSIIKKRNINIGMAAALPSGNLIVPVIKNADERNLLGLTKSVNALTQKARTNKLAPDDIQGGTFTISNVGSFGNVMGTPIINQPQVAILAVGSIKKKPSVIETPQGDTIGIRHMMFLSLSYDHRWVDGMLGGSFLRRIADYLEQWDINRTI